MIKTFIVETDQPDSNGDILKFDGLKIADKVLLTREWDHKHPIGPCDIIVNENEIKATANIPDALLDSYPAIGLQIISAKKENGYRIITEAKLHYVGLCSSPNVNHSIKKISEQ